MTPPTVLLDQSFLAALVDPELEYHVVARQRYQRLIDEYAANTIRLRARRDHLGDLGRQQHRDLLAPVEAIHVAGQFRRQARRLGNGHPPDRAITLVVMRRESIVRIATFDPFFDDVEVAVEQ